MCARVSVCLSVWVYTHSPTAHMWKSGDKWQSFFSFHHMAHGDQSQVGKFGNECLCLMCRLAIHSPNISKIFFLLCLQTFIHRVCAHTAVCMHGRTARSHVSFQHVGSSAFMESALPFWASSLTLLITVTKDLMTRNHLRRKGLVAPCLEGHSTF